MSTATKMVRTRSERSVVRCGVALGASAVLVCAGVLAGAAFMPGAAMQAQAASKASINKKMHKLVKKQAKKYVKKSTGVDYTWIDLTGDGIHEGIIDYHPSGGGSGHVFRIYKYKNGKLKRILNDGEYGMYKLKVYRKTKSFAMYCAGHGGEHIDYFTMKSGKFKRVAMKGRTAINGGSDHNGPWSYRSSRGTEISKASYKAKVKKLTKGSAKTTYVSKWKYLSSY